MSDSAAERTRRQLTWAGLLGVVVLGFIVRSLGLEDTFVGDGEVVFRMDDAQYHARRALFSFVNFPRVLVWDSYLNHPQGAHVPWPPLYDLALAGAARAFGDSLEVFERVLAWTPVVLGSLTVLPIYAAARAVAGRGLALGSAALFAVLPASVVYSDVGNPDHHVAVAFIGAVLLALILAAVRPDARGRRLAAIHAGLVLARCAMLLTWHGSLLYLGIGEVALLAAAAVAGRRDALAAQAAGAALTAALVAPVVAFASAPVAGPYSAIELSWLHVAALAATAVAAAAIAALDRAKPEPRALVRALRAGAIAAAVVGLLLALPGPREGLEGAREYATKQERFIAGNYENQPIFRDGSPQVARFLFGEFGFLVPLAPLAALARARKRRVREPALVLAVWTAVFAGLALDQSRYANDFAPGGSVALALLLAEARGLLVRRFPGSRRLAEALALAVGVALVWQPLQHHAAKLPGSLGYLRGATRAGDPALETLEGTLYRFGRQIRAATPETAGFFDPKDRPEYGVLAFPLIGFLVHYTARRSTPADNFGPYLGGTRYTETNRFYALQSESEAIASAKRLGVRYVVTADEGRPSSSMLLYRLHRMDGTSRDAGRRLERFRLATEGPNGGFSIGRLSGTRPASGVPYKLFEIVEGALLVVRAEPGTAVVAEVEIETPIGRRFVYRARALADDDGRASLRVPYATDAQLPARTTGPYRVAVGGRIREVSISEADVLEGAVIDLDQSDPAGTDRRTSIGVLFDQAAWAVPDLAPSTRRSA